MDAHSSAHAHAITKALRRLCELEMPASRMRMEMTDYACSMAIKAIRKRLPVSILDHHDRMLQRGYRSIASVNPQGQCGNCHTKVPQENLKRLRMEGGLELCDQCGGFLYLGKGPTGQGQRIAEKWKQC